MMATSGVEEAAESLLAAFYDLSGGSLARAVPLRDPDRPQRGAAVAAGLGEDPTMPDIAVRYLLNGGYLEEEERGSAEAAAPARYFLSVAGLDRIRSMRGLDTGPALAGGTMSEKTQRRLLTVLAIVLSMVLTRPLTRFIDEQIPERRGIRDDLMEAFLKGATRMVAIFIASQIVRKLASR